MKKTVLSILLALLLVVGSLPMAVNAAEADAAPVAADTVVSETMIGGGSAPKAGSTPSYSWAVHASDSVKFDIKSNAWYNLTDNTQMLKTSTFVNTKTYALYLELEAKDGYVFDDAANIYTGFWSTIQETTHVVYNIDKTHKTIGIYFTFRMSGDTGSCILQFLPNGGFGSKRPVVVTKGNAYTLPANSFTPPTGGYFREWDAGNKGDSFNVTKDKDITALWNTVFVDTVGVTGIASPAWGTSPDYTAQLVGSGFKINTDYDDGMYIKNGIEWRKFDGTRISHSIGFSNSEYRYYVTIYLKANTLRWFDDVAKMTATVNGLKANVETDDRAAEPDSGKYIKITYGYQPLLSSMWIKVTEPAAYQKPSYNPNVDNNYSAKLNKNKNTDTFTGGVYWLDLNTRKIMQPDEVFLPGHAYRVVIDIVPANNFEFPVDSQLHTFLPSVRVNDTAVKKADGGYGDFVDNGIRGELEAWVACDFPAVEDTASKITQADVSVTAPVPGEHPVFTAAVGEKGYKVKSVEWISVATGGSLTSSAVFEAGKEYTVKVTLAADEGFLFDATVYATVNGKGSDYDVSADRTELVMNHTFALPIAKERIDSIEIIVPEPAEGQPISPIAYLPDGAHYTLDPYTSDNWDNGVCWADENGKDIPKNSGAVFEAGKKYTVTVSVVPIDEDRYEFADVSDLTATVNGKAPRSVSSYDPKTVFVLYTFTVPEEGVLLGDADGDGQVTILDATAIQRHLVKLPTESFIEKAADADENGKIEILDATAIQRWLVKLSTHEGIGEKYV